MPSSSSSRLRLAPRLIAVAAAVYAFVWVSGFPRQYDDDELPPNAQRKKASPATAAPHHVDVDQFVVTIKTTATEAYAKLPIALLLSNTVYHDTLNVVSDLQMDVGAFHVHDALDRIDAKLRDSNPDLERYVRQLHFAQASIDLNRLREADGGKEKEAVAMLDKYKTLRTLERAWQLKPDRSWYAFVDADTYLVRSNIMAWLGQFDSSQPIFFANPPELDTATFVLSRQAMHQLLVDRENVVANWDARISDFRSGFEVLSSALSTELKLGFNLTWPAISGFHPASAPYGAGIWCEPVMAMHKLPAELASDMWRLQRDREEYHHIHDPLTFADLWTRFVQPEHLDKPRDNWDNLSSDRSNANWNILFEQVERKPPHVAEHLNSKRDEDGRAASGEASWEACSESCNNNPLCMQFSYSSLSTPNHNENGDTKCHLSRSMRLGSHAGVRETEVDKRTRITWKSGWRKDRFEKWAQQQRCKGQQDKN